MNFNFVDNIISHKHVKRFIKYEYKPKKVQSQLTNLIVYVLKLLILIELSLMLIV